MNATAHLTADDRGVLIHCPQCHRANRIPFVSDAMAIQFDQPGEAVRLERAARRARVESMNLGRLQPLLLDRTAGQTSGFPRSDRRKSAPCSSSAAWSR